MAGRRHADTVSIPSVDTHNPMHALAGIAPPPWTEQALCAQVDPEIFFPDKGGSTREAKRICASCPVAAECLDWALEAESRSTWRRYGIWGGLSERERRRISAALSNPNPPLEEPA